MNIKLYVPEASNFANKSLKFEVEDTADFERKLVGFFVSNDLKQLLYPDTGKIKDIYSYVHDEKVYTNINDIQLKDYNEITMFAYILGG